ncbi:response regulator transcription factor [Microbulbifer bruguierae]|uniref:Response regulator transcription factor n=1 Tax=Microbulbifer bruguierae TaxID=3029061 RepID=A0ABY8N9H7_9GAMM|nr:response regulator transcription factor [Microbulbifer bruguierae]WGL15555.1 response regulator transcription factor [Microbulbifer bruguierae]
MNAANTIPAAERESAATTSSSGPSSGHRLLLLEDDEQLAQLIQRFLADRGCDVTYAANGNEFMKAIHHREYDLIIADVVLPDASGFQLLEQFRSQLSCPLIFLSALSSVDDQVAGLRLGANDYLVKPVDPHLLWAKIEAQLRLSNSQAAPVASLTFGPLVVDLVSRQAIVHDTTLSLTTNEFDLLQIFAEQPARLLSREYLFRRVIGREFDGLDRVIDMRVSRLRKKLDAIPGGVAIQSIRGRGYSLNTARD